MSTSADNGFGWQFLFFILLLSILSQSNFNVDNSDKQTCEKLYFHQFHRVILEVFLKEELKRSNPKGTNGMIDLPIDIKKKKNNWLNWLSKRKNRGYFNIHITSMQLTYFCTHSFQTFSNSWSIHDSQINSDFELIIIIVNDKRKTNKRLKLIYKNFLNVLSERSKRRKNTDTHSLTRKKKQAHGNECKKISNNLYNYYHMLEDCHL